MAKAAGRARSEEGAHAAAPPVLSLLQGHGGPGRPDPSAAPVSRRPPSTCCVRRLQAGLSSLCGPGPGLWSGTWWLLCWSGRQGRPCCCPPSGSCSPLETPTPGVPGPFWAASRLRVRPPLRSSVQALHRPSWRVGEGLLLGARMGRPRLHLSRGGAQHLGWGALAAGPIAS